MIFGLIGGLVLGGGAAWLQLQQGEVQFDIAISVGLVVVLYSFARSVGGWGLLIGVAAVFAMWSVILGGGFVGSFDQTLAIYRNLFERLIDDPERIVALMEDIAHLTSRYDLEGEVPPEGVLGIWAVEAFAILIAAIAGASAGKRARARAEAPETSVGAGSGGASPWRGRRPAGKPGARPPSAGQSAMQGGSKAASPSRANQPVMPVRTPTIVDTRRSRRTRGGPDYVN